MKREGESSDLIKSLEIYFKTIQMESPKVTMQESDEYPDEVALSLSLVPTFHHHQESKIRIEVDETPELLETND